MSKKPRWINEIPRPIKYKDKRELSESEKKEAREFEEAVKNDSIKEWFERE